MSNLKNYTTAIDAHQTVTEIEKMLVEHGAIDIMKNYTTDHEINAIMFSINTKTGQLLFKLPCETDKIKKLLYDLKKLGKLKGLSYKKAETTSHARNVGWRIIKDWIDAQLSLIKIGVVSLDQIFLPYAYDPFSKKTFYEKLKEDNFKQLKE